MVPATTRLKTELFEISNQCSYRPCKHSLYYYQDKHQL